jgi:Na+/H+ antiporter NhaD/arsenite permease-like protein
MTLAQIVTLIIFVVMFAAIIQGRLHRFIPALAGAAAVILLVFLVIMKSPHAISEVMALGQLGDVRFWVPGHEHLESYSGVNWQTIIFIAGMMVMVEGMADAGFFRWLCLVVAKQVKYRVVPILVTFMLLAGFLAMFIDSITVLLFLAVTTIELARLLKFDPVPVIISEIFAANVGGSATMSGDPPNIIIGTAFGYTFTDFLLNTGVIAWIGMLAALVFFYFAFRKQLLASHKGWTPPASYPQPREAIRDRSLFGISTGIFLFVVVLLLTHAATGLSVAAIGVTAAVLTLLAAGRDRLSIVRRFDWRTMLFLMGLFIVVGGLEITGVLTMLAEFIGNVSGGNTVLMITIILWLSAFASAVVDNIPFAATMVPVIRNLALTQGIDLHTLSWSLALGTDIGGNGTPIGASANVVGTAIAEREGHPISWGRFMKYAMPAMIITVGLCMLYLILRYT